MWKPAAVYQMGHEGMFALHGGEELQNFRLREDG